MRLERVTEASVIVGPGQTEEHEAVRLPLDHPLGTDRLDRHPQPLLCYHVGTGQKTHTVPPGKNHTLCGDTPTQTRIATPNDPTCQWCQGATQTP